MAGGELPQLWLERGVAASEAGEHDEAERAFFQALALDSGFSAAALGLGLTYMAQRRFPEAVPPLRRAAAGLDTPGAWIACLAQALYMTGDFSGCVAAFERAARVEPLGDNARLTLAGARSLAAMTSGPVDRALADYQAETGGDAEGLIEFAQEASNVLAAFGYAAPAADLVRWQLGQAPGDPVLAYRLQALEGAPLDRSPPSYVEAHFDGFAARFDQQLVEMLNYAAPAELAALLAGSRFARALDLGCGTGLAAESLALLTDHLTGVDLSGGMLARAGARGGYDVLFKAEALDFLRDHTGGFDLVFAADVLIYFGDLAPLFDAVAGALERGGVFAFSTERGEADWALLSSGRFAHADAYVDRLAARNFELRTRAPTHLRQEAGGQVEGALHLLVRR